MLTPPSVDHPWLLPHRQSVSLFHAHRYLHLCPGPIHVLTPDLFPSYLQQATHKAVYPSHVVGIIQYGLILSSSSAAILIPRTTSIIGRGNPSLGAALHIDFHFNRVDLFEGTDVLQV